MRSHVQLEKSQMKYLPSKGGYSAPGPGRPQTGITARNAVVPCVVSIACCRGSSDIVVSPIVGRGGFCG